MVAAQQAEWKEALAAYVAVMERVDLSEGFRERTPEEEQECRAVYEELAARARMRR
jgi:hypothetical protein